MNAERVALPFALVAIAAAAIVATPSEQPPHEPSPREVYGYPYRPIRHMLPAEPVITPNGADAVEKAARDNQFLITRCWTLSLNKHPKLVVERSHATIGFDRDGKVSMLALDGIPADDGGLAACLDGVIRRDWRIDGKWAGTYKITLTFN